MLMLALLAGFSLRWQCDRVFLGVGLCWCAWRLFIGPHPRIRLPWCGQQFLRRGCPWLDWCAGLWQEVIVACPRFVARTLVQREVMGGLSCLIWCVTLLIVTLFVHISNGRSEVSFVYVWSSYLGHGYRDLVHKAFCVFTRGNYLHFCTYFAVPGSGSYPFSSLLGFYANLP